jgi:uncharacterized protein with GYD domain
MNTYIMMGKYSIDSIGKINAARTKRGKEIITRCEGELKTGYALLGERDLVIIAEFPSTEKAIKASSTLSKELGIGFTTSPAISFEEFDKVMAGK